MKDENAFDAAEAELHALVDDRLDPARRAALQARLASDPQAAHRAEAWLAQREALRALHREVLDESVPPSLLQAARRMGALRQGLDRWQRWGGMAASVALAFAVGWASHGQWQARRDAPGGPAVQARLASDFGRQAAVAHAVYAPEVRHPVEVEAAQQEHLVRWLSRRLNRPLKLPLLTAQGYELVGGRLLPGDRGARAQFMYQNAAGERITLYVGALDDPEARRQGGETAFRFTSDGPVASFYWIDQGFGYALAGKLPRARLLDLSEVVYKQL